MCQRDYSGLFYYKTFAKGNLKCMCILYNTCYENVSSKVISRFLTWASSLLSWLKCGDSGRRQPACPWCHCSASGKETWICWLRSSQEAMCCPLWGLRTSNSVLLSSSQSSDEADDPDQKIKKLKQNQSRNSSNCKNRLAVLKAKDSTCTA